MAEQNNTQPAQVDYISCDVPTEMTLEQFRRANCQEHRRLQRLRDLRSRWLHKSPRQ